ncbi:fbbe2212-fe1f-4c48-aee0-6b30c2723d3e-CDS [Sclerotinia trifoliorum]|uniref:Fbbe2212-fe1f-4c48-aee0-6b30c2723d3e-CDS n=1 Tax=Sclerotinia trifoliorum TaxID=28548 RepID=A0A8H2ZMB2_9HELO|nr:fbbe2212-fe1f-4c48-aee0-6b30c2723d3e-CDS [Sclerotinia trifoliorum]
MASFSLSSPVLIDEFSYISPPSARAFEEEFVGILPPGKDIQSSRGIIHYYDFNPEASPTAKRVLLIHGIGTCAIGMAPLAHRLTVSGSHVVIYDLWGHGNSSTPLETHTPALMHEQIFELLSHLRWSTMHIIGFSLGGSILATFTAIHPHIVESATIIAGAGLWRKRGSGWWSKLRRDGEWILDDCSEYTIIDELEGNDPSKEGWKERLKHGKVESEPIEIWERENHAGHKASVVSIFRYGNVFDQHESYRKLTNNNLKILVIVGETDSVFPSEFVKSELDALGWKKDVKLVDGAGHGIVRTHPEEVAGLIEAFWEEREVRSEK